MCYLQSICCDENQIFLFSLRFGQQRFDGGLIYRAQCVLDTLDVCLLLVCSLFHRRRSLVLPLRLLRLRPFVRSVDSTFRLNAAERISSLVAQVKGSPLCFELQVAIILGPNWLLSRPHTSSQSE